METSPQSVRTHIGFFGRCNSGKSSLLNALSGQQLSIVSAEAGTTTDPVVKSMEINGIGACVLIDTAGLDDLSTLGRERMARSRKAAERTDVAVIVCTEGDLSVEKEWVDNFRRRSVPVVAVLNKTDLAADVDAAADEIAQQLNLVPVRTDALHCEGIDRLLTALSEVVRESGNPQSLTGNLVSQGDVVVLVMPQDPQAPRGRLILPQVQVIRDLIDKRCVVVGCTTEQLALSLASLHAAPKLIITDSQAFAKVEPLVPKGTLLTSFSVLMACYKGDIRSFVAGARAIERLTPQSRVLVAEACTHAPMEEDIGRVKLPRMLRQRVGESLRVDVVAGADFPTDLTPYDLVIHCGACMFNRRHVLTRIAEAADQNVPITNYGIALAYLTSVLDRVVWPTD